MREEARHRHGVRGLLVMALTGGLLLGAGGGARLSMRQPTDAVPPPRRAAWSELPPSESVDVAGRQPVPESIGSSEEPAEPGVRLSGSIRDIDGSPVAEAWVALGATGYEEAAACTAADGSFELPARPPGRYALRVDCRDRPSLRRDDIWLRQDLPALRLVLGRGASVSGVVRPWAPDDRAEVVWAHADGASRRIAVGPDGTYAASRLTAGRYRVWVDRGEATRRASVAQSLRSDEAEHDLQLADGDAVRFDPRDVAADMACLRGLVAHPRPQSLAVVAWPQFEPPAQRWPLAPAATPAPCGEFCLDGLLPGRWEIVLQAADGGVLQRTSVWLWPSEERQVLLRPAGDAP